MVYRCQVVYGLRHVTHILLMMLHRVVICNDHVLECSSRYGHKGLPLHTIPAPIMPTFQTQELRTQSVLASSQSPALHSNGRRFASGGQATALFALPLWLA